MSVFSFSKSEAVWGVKAAITMNMIDWWIAHAGPKPYLLQIHESYDLGFKHGDLQDVVPEDKAELRDMVQLMLREKYEENYYGADTPLAAELRAALVEFERLLNADLYGTPFHQPGNTHRS